MIAVVGGFHCLLKRQKFAVDEGFSRDAWELPLSQLVVELYGILELVRMFIAHVRPHRVAVIGTGDTRGFSDFTEALFFEVFGAVYARNPVINQGVVVIDPFYPAIALPMCLVDGYPKPLLGFLPYSLAGFVS